MLCCIPQLHFFIFSFECTFKMTTLHSSSPDGDVQHSDKQVNTADYEYPEVAPFFQPSYAGPIPAPPKEPAILAYYQQQHHTSPSPDSLELAGSEPVVKAGRPRWLVPLFFAVIAAIVSATISGVAVWKVTSSKYAPDGSSSPECPANTFPNANVATGGAQRMIRNNSGLAAIGWYVQDLYFIQILYQAPNDNVMTSWYQSMFSNWSMPLVVSPDTSVRAVGGTPFAVSTLYRLASAQDGGKMDAQNQFNFLEQSGKVSGYNFRQAWPLGYLDGIARVDNMASTKSSLSSLWPWNHYQDDKGMIQEVDSAINGTAIKAITNASPGTPLLALPLRTKHTRSELRLFYRNNDGMLSIYERDFRGKETTGPGSLGSVSIPSDATLAGFAMARGAQIDSINTIVIWQDASQAGDNGGIRIMTDGESGWKGPVSNPVFADAGVPTRVACINEGMGEVSSGPGITLSMKKDLNMCFFQTKEGKLKYVWYNGTNWVNMGFLPMP